MTNHSKAQLAEARINGFAVGTEVQIKSGGKTLVGTVTSSNGFITTVTTKAEWDDTVTITRSWATRAVKFAN